MSSIKREAETRFYRRAEPETRSQRLAPCPMPDSSLPGREPAFCRTADCQLLASIEQLRELGHERLVRHVEAQRRHGDTVVGERGDVAAVGRWRAANAHIGD